MRITFLLSSALLLFLFSASTGRYVSNDANTQGIYDSVVYPPKGTALGTYYNVDGIEAIEITNDWKESKRLLNTTQLQEFKDIMKNAVYDGTLGTKPGHLFIRVRFKGEKDFSRDYIYLSSEAINFDKGTNTKRQKFAGAFRPSGKVNFEQY